MAVGRNKLSDGRRSRSKGLAGNFGPLSEAAIVAKALREKTPKVEPYVPWDLRSHRRRARLAELQQWHNEHGTKYAEPPDSAA